MYLKFSESYNLSPPEVFFITIPYHPNGKENDFGANEHLKKLINALICKANKC